MTTQSLPTEATASHGQRTKKPTFFKALLFLILLGVIGFGIAAVFVAMLLVFDVQNLWSLISGSDVGLLAVFMLWFFNGIVFAGVQFGIYVMLMAETENTDGDCGPGLVDYVPVRIPVDQNRNVPLRRLRHTRR